VELRGFEPLSATYPARPGHNGQIMDLSCTNTCQRLPPSIGTGEPQLCRICAQRSWRHKSRRRPLDERRSAAGTNELPGSLPRDSRGDPGAVGAGEDGIAAVVKSDVRRPVRPRRYASLDADSTFRAEPEHERAVGMTDANLKRGRQRRIPRRSIAVEVFRRVDADHARDTGLGRFVQCGVQLRDGGAGAAIASAPGNDVAHDAIPFPVPSYSRNSLTPPGASGSPRPSLDEFKKLLRAGETRVRFGRGSQLSLIDTEGLRERRQYSWLYWDAGRGFPAHELSGTYVVTCGGESGGQVAGFEPCTLTRRLEGQPGEYGVFRCRESKSDS